jgi:hypothetical protein
MSRVSRSARAHRNDATTSCASPRCGSPAVALSCAHLGVDLAEDDDRVAADHVEPERDVAEDPALRHDVPLVRILPSANETATTTRARGSRRGHGAAEQDARDRAHDRACAHTPRAHRRLECEALVAFLFVGAPELLARSTCEMNNRGSMEQPTAPLRASATHHLADCRHAHPDTLSRVPSASASGGLIASSDSSTFRLANEASRRVKASTNSPSPRGRCSRTGRNTASCRPGAARPAARSAKRRARALDAVTRVAVCCLALSSRGARAAASLWRRLCKVIDHAPTAACQAAPLKTPHRAKRAPLPGLCSSRQAVRRQEHHRRCQSTLDGSHSSLASFTS